MTTTTIRSQLVRAAAIASLMAGCSQVSKLADQGGAAPVRPDPPRISVVSVELASAPGNVELAKYFCPQVANALVCRAFGAAPAAGSLKFVFDVTLDVANQNTVPLPAVEAMVAFTAYPDRATEANIGAVCIALCPEGEDCGPPPEDGCASAGEGLKSMTDYATAAAGFLVAVATGNASVGDVRVRTIPAGGNVQVQARFEIDPEGMLRLIANVASDALRSLESGSQPTFTVPFSLEGTLWVNVDNFGKIAAGFGPHRDTWALR